MNKFLFLLLLVNTLNCNSQVDSAKTVEVHKVTFNLPGRQLVKFPPNITDWNEKGIVVIEIVVDSNGKVIKAKINTEGSTTSNVILLAKALQASKQAQFSKTQFKEDQVGTITIAVDLTQ